MYIQSYEITITGMIADHGTPAEGNIYAYLTILSEHGRITFTQFDADSAYQETWNAMEEMLCYAILEGNEESGEITLYNDSGDGGRIIGATWKDMYSPEEYGERITDLYFEVEATPIGNSC